jgi:transcription elongation factor Elf1
MPKGIPKAGFRRTGRRKSKTLQEFEQELALKVPDIVAELEKLTKPFPCPHCGNEIKMIDKDVGMYLVDRVLGKPKQKHEVDITENIQLTADQIDMVLKNHLPQIVELYKPEIRGLLTEGTPGNTETNKD